MDYLDISLDNPFVWGMLEEQRYTEELERNVYDCIAYMRRNYGNEIPLNEAEEALAIYNINFFTLPQELKDALDDSIEIID